MPGQGKYTTYTPIQNATTVKGSSNTTLLKSLFNPPDHVGNKQKTIELAKEYLLADSAGGIQKGDPDHFSANGGVVNLNYAGSPDYAKDAAAIVKTGDKGNPSTSYTPNLTSPGEANGVSPDGQSDMKVNDVAGRIALNGRAKEGVDGLRNPAVDASTMGSTTLMADGNPLVPGKHPGA